MDSRFAQPRQRVGGSALTDLLVKRSAVISECGTYRYELRRVWNDRLPPYVSGMLNPSTADHEIDDPTIIRNWRRAEAVGCGSLIVWNLGAARTTEPAKWRQMPDPIGPENDDHIRRILGECWRRSGTAVVGWGTLGSFMGRDKIARRIAAEAGVTLYCLGTTRDGQPRHPLYIANAQPLLKWRNDQSFNGTLAT